MRYQTCLAIEVVGQARVYRCSLCAVPYIFSFRFSELNLQIAESIWCGSPRKWSWNGGVVSVESIFICPGQRLSSHLFEWLAKWGALVATNIGCQLTSYIRRFAHAFTLLRPELLVSRERKGCCRGEYIGEYQKHFHNCFQKSCMVVCIRQFTPQLKVFGLQIPYPYSLILYSKVVTLIRVRLFWYLNFECLFRNTKFKTVVSIFWSSWTKSKHRIL